MGELSKVSERVLIQEYQTHQPRALIVRDERLRSLLRQMVETDIPGLAISSLAELSPGYDERVVGEMQWAEEAVR